MISRPWLRFLHARPWPLAGGLSACSVAALLGACSPEAGRDAQVAARGSTVLLSSITAPALSGVPECDASREGSVVYALDTKTEVEAFYVCVGGTWTALPGSAGTATAVGPTGPAGPTGAPGATGPEGAPGATGAEGPRGADGPAGAQGEVGEAGPPGGSGATGATGAGALVQVEDVPPGEAGCVAGGTRVRAGLDEDMDGVLDASEVQSEQVICFAGAAGATGAAGADGLGTQAELEAVPTAAQDASTPCPLGGYAIRSWLDQDGDGQFDRPSSAAELGEQTGVTYVCNTSGSTGLITHIDATVEVTNSVQLAMLQGLESISGRLTISIPGIPHVGLPALRTAQELLVTNCMGLTSLDLPSLESVPGSLTVFLNPALVTLGGQGGVQQGQGFLPALESVGVLGIQSNPQLQSIFGIGSLQTVTGSVQIENNPRLSTYPAFAGIPSEKLTIVNNGTGIGGGSSGP